MKGINCAEDPGVAITVSDTDGKILCMNGNPASTFAKEGEGATVTGPADLSMKIPFKMDHFVRT
jgi:hypothetical protein